MKRKVYISPETEFVYIKGMKLLVDVNDGDTTSGNQEDANAKRLFGDPDFDYDDIREEDFEQDLWK
ncbi:MAG: hypothetical protein IJM81_00770 [Prevotella sp.]|nr:hypothetical protein [Prevotella sp.]